MEDLPLLVCALVESGMEILIKNPFFLGYLNIFQLKIKISGFYGALLQLLRSYSVIPDH